MSRTPGEHGTGLNGRVAIITGSSRGIGLGIARHLAAQGMAVAVNDVHDGALRAAEDLAATGARSLGIVADVGVKADVESMFERVEAELGPVWLLVNNAAVFPVGPTATMAEEDWDRVMRVDAKGTFLCSQAAIRRMIPRKAGRIVNVTSIAAAIVRTGQIGYCSAKAAMNHFTRCLAVEMGPEGITVNALLPGMTYSDMLAGSFAERGLDLSDSLALIPDGRLAQPEDHAALIAWLASDAAAHVTGQLIAVDGGQSLFMPLVSAPKAKPA